MPAYLFVLLSNWPVIPIAVMDLVGVAVGFALYRRRQDWPPLVVMAAFGLRAISSVTRFLFYLTGYLVATNYYNDPAFSYDPVTGAFLQQTMNCVVAAGGVVTLALLQVAIWHGFTARPKFTTYSDRP